MKEGYDIIIPVYNEKNIIKLLDYLFDNIKNYNILYICYDQEEDITIQLIKKSKYKNSKIIKLFKNPLIGPVKPSKWD